MNNKVRVWALNEQLTLCTCTGGRKAFSRPASVILSGPPWWKSLKDLQGSLKISMRTFEDPTEDPDKDLYKIFKDLQGSSKFLPRSSRIFKVLTKIFKDLLFSCQDPQGSTKIFQFLAKIFKDLQRSSKFLPRSTRIFKVLAKIFKDL